MNKFKIWDKKYLFNRVLKKLKAPNSEYKSPEAQLCQECKNHEGCDVVDESCENWEPA